MIAMLAIALFAVSAIHAQVSVSAKLDSVQFYVGQQDGIELKVTMPAGGNLQMPVLKKGMELMPDVEIISVDAPDTMVMNDGKQWQVSQRYIITAWASSF